MSSQTQINASKSLISGGKENRVSPDPEPHSGFRVKNGNFGLFVFVETTSSAQRVSVGFVGTFFSSLAKRVFACSEIDTVFENVSRSFGFLKFYSIIIVTEPNPYSGISPSYKCKTRLPAVSRKSILKSRKCRFLNTGNPKVISITYFDNFATVVPSFRRSLPNLSASETAENQIQSHGHPLCTWLLRRFCS